MGSNNSFEFYHEHVDVYGFGQGFALGGDYAREAEPGHGWTPWEEKWTDGPFVL